ncbi:MAG TPA: hypothetical protein VGU20_20930 [Stellaceae bacterium]|nr:hypothetical protein [Stellaceae bacterium]
MRPLTIKLIVIALAMSALAGCYNGLDLRDCSEWRTTSIPGCYDGQGGGGRD